MKILSATQIDHIEKRLNDATITSNDVRALINTVRHLMSTQSQTGSADRRPEVLSVELPQDINGRVEVFTDGACSGNPGPGGWGAIVRIAGEDLELSGGESDTTNNRMELTAAIQALRSLPGTCDVTVCTDSEYVKKGITSWIDGWKKNGWKTSQRKPVKNSDLWKELDELNGKHKTQWQWVRGHAGHPENERCDQLANAAIPV